jgi:hypothetical protein
VRPAAIPDSGPELTPGVSNPHGLKFFLRRQILDTRIEPHTSFISRKAGFFREGRLTSSRGLGNRESLISARRDDPLAFSANDFRLTGTVEEVHGFSVMSTQGTGNGRVSW